MRWGVKKRHAKPEPRILEFRQNNFWCGYEATNPSFVRKMTGKSAGKETDPGF